MKNNDVPEPVLEEEDEQEILNVQNNDDISGEYGQDKDLVQAGEGAQDVTIVQYEDIKKEEDGKEEAVKEKEFGLEDVNKKESKEVKTVQKKGRCKGRCTRDGSCTRGRRHTRDQRFSKGRRSKATWKGEGLNTRGGIFKRGSCTGDEKPEEDKRDEIMLLCTLNTYGIHSLLCIPSVGCFQKLSQMLKHKLLLKYNVATYLRNKYIYIVF